MDRLLQRLWPIGLIVLLAACVWLEVSAWQECLGSHSTWYCIRTLGN